MANALWDSYFYKGTTTLRNKHGILDARELRRRWYALADARILELQAQGSQLQPASGVPDLAFMQAIHRHINQDTFDWAGELRVVNMYKGSARASLCRVETIPAAAAVMDDYYRAHNGFENMQREPFLDCFTVFAGEWNRIHPFRDANGRACKVFLGYVADRAGYTFELKNVAPEDWNSAFAQDARGMPHTLRQVLSRAVRSKLARDFELMEPGACVQAHPALGRVQLYLAKLVEMSEAKGAQIRQIEAAVSGVSSFSVQ